MTADTPRQDGEQVHRYLVEARTKLYLAYPDDSPHLSELHIVGVTLKGLDEYEAVVEELVTDATAKAYEAGRNAEAKTCEQAGRHAVKVSNPRGLERDKALAVIEARIDATQFVQGLIRDALSPANEVRQLSRCNQLDSILDKYVAELTAQKAKLEGDNRG